MLHFPLVIAFYFYYRHKPLNMQRSANTAGAQNKRDMIWEKCKKRS